MNGNKDKRYAFDEAWYKESKYGSCPEDNFGLVASYLLRFGCDVKDAKNVRIHKSNEAKQCASQRMSDMKYRANNRRKIDANHVYPILLAKGLGHECLSLSNDTKHLLEEYTHDFSSWYNQLVQGHPDIHAIFNSKVHNTSISNPLNDYDVKTNRSVIATKNKTRKSNGLTHTNASISHVENNNGFIEVPKKTKTLKKKRLPN